MIEISVFAPCCHTHYQRFSRRKLLFHIFHTIYKVFIYDACVFIQYIYPIIGSLDICSRFIILSYRQIKTTVI